MRISSSVIAGVNYQRKPLHPQADHYPWSKATLLATPCPRMGVASKTNKWARLARLTSGCGHKVDEWVWLKVNKPACWIQPVNSEKDPIDLL